MNLLVAPIDTLHTLLHGLDGSQKHMLIENRIKKIIDIISFAFVFAYRFESRDELKTVVAEALNNGELITPRSPRSLSDDISTFNIISDSLLNRRSISKNSLRQYKLYYTKPADIGTFLDLTRKFIIAYDYGCKIKATRKFITDINTLDEIIDQEDNSSTYSEPLAARTLDRDVQSTYYGSSKTQSTIRNNPPTEIFHRPEVFNDAISFDEFDESMFT